MERPTAFYLRTTHDCGHKREVPIEEIEQTFVCEGCGRTDQIEPAQIKTIYDRAGAALLEANRQRDETGEETRVEWDMHEGRYR